jgi:hypothetical protein
MMRSTATQAWRGADFGARLPVILLAVASLLMLGAALFRLPQEFVRQITEPAGLGGMDLKLRWLEVHRWFAGLPVYGSLEHADYPPASYAILWPALGWLDMEAARWFWAATTAVVLTVLCAQLLRGSLAATRWEKAFVILLPLAGFPTAASVRLGQLGLHVIVLTLGGLLMIGRGPSRWPRDLAAAALLLPTLVKPTLSVPFFALGLLLPGGVRPVVLAAVGYGLLTLVAAGFQHADPVSLLGLWLQQRGEIDTAAAHGNLHASMEAAGLGDWMGFASLAALAALSLWVLNNRRADIWLLLAVTAFTARMFAHHRHYDDALVLIPMVALFRGSHQDGRSAWGLLGLWLLAALWAFSVAPAQILSLAWPWGDLFKIAKTAAWLAALAFLIARTGRRTPVATAA